MKRVFVPTRSGSDWQRLLAKPKLHWKRGASAMTAAASWEAAGGDLPFELSALFNESQVEELADLKLLVALPEWEVELEGGITTSHTDVLALCSNSKGLCIVAVEAKVDEDFGPLVSEKRHAVSEGQKARLQFLTSLLKVESFSDDIRYQLLHRVASAILTARAFHAASAVMVVQSFGSRESLRSDFETFCGELGAQRVQPGLMKVPAIDAPRLFVAWCSGDKRFLNVELPGHE